MTITISVRGIAQPGSVHAWGAWGRKFESCCPDQIKSKAYGLMTVGLFVLFCLRYISSYIEIVRNGHMCILHAYIFALNFEL